MSEQQEVVQKPREDKPKGDRQPKEKREKKTSENKKPKKNSQDGENPENQGENGEKTEKKEKRKYESIYDWDYTKVTLETPILQMPKMKDQVKEPEESRMEQRQAAIEAKIQDLFEKKKKFIQDLRAKGREAAGEKQQGTQALHSVLNEQIDERKAADAEFKLAKAEFDAHKKKQVDIFNETDRIRKNMNLKIPFDQLEEALEEKQWELDNGTITSSEEKKLITEIEGLKKSLPLAQKIKPLEEQLKVLKENSRQYRDKMNDAFQRLQKARDLVSATISDKEEQKQMSEKSKESIEPIIEAKKQEIQEQVDKLKQQKKDIFTEYKDQKKKFREQQELERYIKWQKKQMENLRKKKRWEDNQARKAEEEKFRQEEEQAKIIQVNPFASDIRVCEELIAFCKTEIQRNKTPEQIQEEQQQALDISSNTEWKKEKVTLIKSKKQADQEEDDFLNGNKNKKNKKKQFKKEDTTSAKVNLSYEGLNGFATVKVSAPREVSELQKTLELLEEKKKYFEEQPTVETTIDKLREEKKQPQQEEAQTSKKSKKTVQVDNTEDYPEL